ncbi:MAG: hypothetical protein ACR2NZ_08290, partial [Rubripirellula sp.]
NDVGGFYFGKFLIVDTIGIYAALVLCIAFGSLVFLFCLIRCAEWVRPIRNTVAWIVISVVIQTAFYAVGLFP